MYSSSTLRDGLPSACGDEWLLYWTRRGAEVPVGRFALLDAWADIDARERLAGIEGGTPILVDPACRIDPRLARFFRRSRFAFLAEGSRRSYVKLCRRRHNIAYADAPVMPRLWRN